MKKLMFLFIFLFTAPLFFTGCTEQVEILNSYDIFIQYDDQNKTADCYQTVKYINKSDNVFEELYFHLYPNAFREGAKNKVVGAVNFDKAYPNGESFGEINIESVKIGQKQIDFQISGEDENILIIPLIDKLYPDESVQIEIDYFIILPNINHRFGYGENTINFGNFYPIACVYEDNKGFMQEVYTSNGDPFYSDCANYNVTISYPKNLTLASSGEVISESINQEKRITSVEARRVRDFCFVLSSRFEVIRDNIDGVCVTYYYYDDEERDKSLQTAIDCILTYDKLFGDYPYKTLNVVKTNFVYGGMEYPNLVMISDSIERAEDYQYVIAHEIAHQWWYGVVGNNEYDEAWLDESLTEYATALFFENNKQYCLGYEEIIKNINDAYKQFLRVFGKVYEKLDTSMNRSLDEYKTEPEYVNCVYVKGVLMLDTLRQQVGEKKLLKVFKLYYKEYQFTNATSEDFIAVIEKVCGKGVGDILISWLNGTAVYI